MQTAFAGNECNCSTDAGVAIEDNFLGNAQTSPGSGFAPMNSADNLPQRLYSNRADNSGPSNLTSSHPLMHPTKEQMNKWVGEYRAAPHAYLSPQVRAMLSMFAGAHFSLLNYLQYSPSERNQGHCGNCWAWAGTGVMEIDNAYQNGAKDRLSVQYINSNFHNGKGGNWACCGGWLNDVASFYAANKISIPWSNNNAGWQDGSRSCEDGSTKVSSNTISTDPHYNLASINAVSIPTHGVGKESAIANIKNVLSQGKAIWFGFFLPDSNAWNNFFNFWDAQSESVVWQPDLACGKAFNYNQGGGHAVLCVGYDDTNPQNRYWIMLNSWGASYNRPSGLFLVNMDMNYDCSNVGTGYAFYWMTLNIGYANAPPGVPSIPSGPSAGYVGNSYLYSTSATDSGSYKLKYTLDWGDGTNSTTNSVNSGTIASISHIWYGKGSYQIRARATNINGISSEWSNPLTVVVAANNPPSQPNTPVGPSSGLKKVAYTYSTCTKDPNGDQLSYAFDWGDGTVSTTGLSVSGTDVSASHAWSAPGSYKVRTSATDSNGASSGFSSPLSVAIAANAPPSQPNTPVGPSSGRKQVACTYTTYAKDPNGDQVKYTFDWGDGTASTTGYVSSGKIASSSHKWRSPGTYKVKAIATDGRDASSGWSNSKVVRII